MKPESLPPSDVDRSTTIATSLFLVLLLRKAFAAGDREILIGFVRVRVRNVGIREVRVGIDLCTDFRQRCWFGTLMVPNRL